APGWPALQPLLLRYWHNVARHVAPRHRAGRLKQWLNLLRRRHPQAQQLFDTVRGSNDPVQVQQLLQHATPA
ncbi:MAG: tRNA dihydrouridine(16) synthase DusC, partial [Rubrivivax sp.]